MNLVSSGAEASVESLTTVVVFGWICLNVLAAPFGYSPVDPPPFQWLGGAVSLVSLYMVILILATQRREDELAQHREGANESIGKIDDLIIAHDNRAVFAIISVGGFLGAGSKLVAIQYDQLRPTPDNKGLVLAGATKESLKALPEFAYAK